MNEPSASTVLHCVGRSETRYELARLSTGSLCLSIGTAIHTSVAVFMDDAGLEALRKALASPAA